MSRSPGGRREINNAVIDGGMSRKMIYAQIGSARAQVAAGRWVCLHPTRAPTA